MPRSTVQKIKDAVTGDDFADLAEVDTTQPLDQRTSDGAEIVKATTNGRTTRDIAYGDLIEIVRHAERQVYDSKIAVRLEAEMDNALRQMRARQHVDPAIIDEIVRLATEWQTKASAKDEDGGS